MIRIGLTGGIAAGKSTVATHLRELGATLVDYVVLARTVEAPEQTRVERMMRTRGMSEAQAKARIAHQPTRAARESIADAVIDSSQDVEHMFDCVDRLMEQWRKEARRNHGIQH